MEVLVYNSEKFERSRGWFIWFWIFFSFMIVMSILYDNWIWAVILFMLIWGYLIFSIILMKKVIMKITSEWLIIENKLYPFAEIWGYIIEIDDKNQILKNIVLLIWNRPYIHTFADSWENIKEFILQLDDYVTRYSQFEQPFIERLTRKLKL